MLEAFALIRREIADIKLVLAGPTTKSVDLNAELSRVGLDRRDVVATGYIDDLWAQQLLTNATMLAFVSQYEGFGMPPLEALALGTPVITTRSSSIPEAVGGLALFVDAEDSLSLSALLLRKDFEQVRQSLISSGPQRASEFSWKQTALAFSSTMINSLTTQENSAWQKRQEILREYSQIAINLQH
jgi:glycosyltransferase involved in cell wall biosynthesis